MSDQKKKPLASPETIKQLEDLQAQVQGVADMATKVTQAQKEGGQIDKKALKETLTTLTGMATDLASQVAKLQKDLGMNKKGAGNLQVVKSPDLPKGGRGPIRG